MQSGITQEFCQQIPKVELHAHLNGSLSNKTIKKLLDRRRDLKISTAAFEKGEQRTMGDCFEMFKVIHSLVDSTEVIYEVTKDVIEEFSADGVKYLELRSTPKGLVESGMDKRRYMDAVVGAIRDYKHDNDDVIDVKFLPSIDRGRSIKDAQENLKLAEEYSISCEDIVTGIDFSGNPYTTDAAKFMPVLQGAQRVGLKSAVHLSEVKDRSDETRMFLSVPPDRIGHGTFLTDEEDVKSSVLESRIPIEVCVSSNIASNTSPPEHIKHHSVWWMGQEHPCVVCTDDKGVFSTGLSSEYFIIANALSLSEEQTLKLSESAIDFIFADENMKAKLKQIWKESKKALF
uniref:adenosine deaminase-like protein n=1 Tax=Ciona intestinalis TaxID=7719 RepID=UPI000180C7AA|nr:adenosine deaminase-like protein [Ciona intestinalis]|eukprot:XP_002128674.1 adenosine deaminase-like protein [Ciona intestinalis]